MISMDDIIAINGASDQDFITAPGDSVLREHQKKIRRQMRKSIGYCDDATNNGIPQPVIISANSKNKYEANIIALPGDHLHAGDIISARDTKWIVQSVSATNHVQDTAVASICNLTIKLQDVSGRISAYPCFVRKASNSLGDSNSKIVSYVDSPYEVYLPLDNITQKLYADKRIADGMAFDQTGKQILTVLDVKEVIMVSVNCNDGDHLLLLGCRRGVFNESTDNAVIGICDYVESTVPVTATGATCEIVGSGRIRVGTSLKYEARFYDANHDLMTAPPAHSWAGVPNGCTTVTSGVYLTITIPDEDEFIGEEFTLTLSDDNHSCANSELNVEVIA